MHNTSTSSINPVGAQATNEPEIRLHHDGRVSYKDNKPAHRPGCPLCKASPRRTLAKFASGAVVQYRQCPSCNWHSIARPYAPRGLTQLEIAFTAAGLNGNTKQ